MRKEVVITSIMISTITFLAYFFVVNNIIQAILDIKINIFISIFGSLLIASFATGSFIKRYTKKN